MKRLFNWLSSLFGRKPPVPTPTVSPITEYPGFCTCVVRPTSNKNVSFFIHFLTTTNPVKMEALANRVGVELAEVLSREEFGENPLRFNFTGIRDALDNWRQQPAIAEVRKLVRNMDIFLADEHYLSLSSYGSPALMFRARLLDNVLMTVCFSHSDLLSEQEPVEWLRNDPVSGFTVPKMLLSTGDVPRLSFVQKGTRGNSISLMLDPEHGYELEKVQHLAANILHIAHEIPCNHGLATPVVEKYLDMVAHMYALAKVRFDISVTPGYYHESTLGVFAIALTISSHPPMLLVFMPEGFEPDNLPSVALLTSAIAESVKRPYPVGNVLSTAAMPVEEPTLSFNEFHLKQVRARIVPVTKLVFDRTMESLSTKVSCNEELLAHRFSASDVYALFSLTVCPPEFARLVADKCEILRRNMLREGVAGFVKHYHDVYGRVYGDERIGSFIAKHVPAVGALVAEVRKELTILSVNARNQEMARRAAAQAMNREQRTVHVQHMERPRFRDDWRDVSQPDTMMQAAVLSAVMQDNNQRCETPVSESVCRDDSPASYDGGGSDCGSSPSND